MKNHLKRSFTLVELVSVIVVLGILAAIVMVNVGNSKDKATASYLKSNIHELQSIVDRYYMEEEVYPTALAPTVDTPREIDLDRLRPEYLHSKRLYEKLKEQRYWVDVNGRVWGSVLKLPRTVIQRQDGVEFSSVAGAKYYEIVGVKKKSPSGDVRTVRTKTLGFVSQVKDGMIRAKSEAKAQGKYDYLLVSAHDKFGVQTAPTANGGEGFDPLIRKTGKYQFTVIAERDKAELVDFIKDVNVPEGASVDFTFDTLDMQENPIESGLTVFPKGEKVHGVTVHIEMKASPSGKKPSLYDALVLFKYDEKVQRVEVVGKEATQEVKDKIPECAAGGCVVFDAENADELTDFNFNDRPQNLNEENGGQDENGNDANGGNNTTTDAGASTGDRYEVWDDKIICVVGCAYGEPEDYKADVQTDADKKVTDATIVATPEETKKDVVTPPEDKEEEDDWTTVDDLYLSAGSGVPDAVKWLRAETKDTVSDKEHTRVKYTYSSADGVQNGRIAWQGAYEEFSELPVSRYARAHIEMQVKTKWVGKVTEPEFVSIKFYHERGDSGVLTDEDVTPMILLNKDNNPNSNVVTPTSNVSWDFDLLGKSKDDVVKTEWKTLDSKFAVGTYENTLRVQFKDGKWSKTTTLPFEVKEEKPTVQLTHNVVNQLVYFDEAHSIDWGYVANDPDEDGIKSVKWRGLKKDVYTEEDMGIQTVEVQVEDMEGNLSDWSGYTFSVVNKKPIVQGYQAVVLNNNLAFINKKGELYMRGHYSMGTGMPSLSYALTKESWLRISIPEKIVGIYDSQMEFENDSNGLFTYIAVSEEGNVYGLGRNTNDILAMRTKTDSSAPYFLDTWRKSRLQNIQKGVCGVTECLWLKKDGTVMETNGSFNENPIQVPAGEKVVDIQFLKTIRYMLTESGNIYVWGHDGYYRFSKIPYLFGLGTNTTYVQNPTKIPNLPKITKLSVGNRQKDFEGLSTAMALSADGKIYSWGGMPSTIGDEWEYGSHNVYTPTLIPTPEGQAVKNIWSAGRMIQTMDGRVFVSGRAIQSYYKEAFDANKSPKEWVELPFLKDMKYLAGDTFAGFAMHRDGRLYDVGFKIREDVDISNMREYFLTKLP